MKLSGRRLLSQTFKSQNRMIVAFVATLGVILTGKSAWGAERLTLRLGFFQQSVAIADLEQFAETGQLPPALNAYAPIFTPQVRQLFLKRLQIDPAIAEKFVEDLLRTPDGGRLIQKINAALPNSSVDQLKAALALAVRQANGLSILGFLKAYPTDNLTLDASAALAIAVQLNTSYWQSQALGPLLKSELSLPENTPPFRSQIDPAAAGKEPVEMQTMILRDWNRNRTIPVDLYYSLNRTGPLVVMSHGFAADRRFLSYVAIHLASHGITVASIEHPGSNLTALSEVTVRGNPSDFLPASEFIDRPKDISFLLDQLAQINSESGAMQGKFNTQQVTVIGHSLGGYTALALAGGELNLGELRQYCKNNSPLGRAPADWFQCAAAEFPDGKVQLKDPRVVQAIALNPVIGSLFGKTGLTSVKVPTLILTGTEDAVTPALDHQLRPFTQLGGRKYLLAAIGGTHLSISDPSNLSVELAQNTLVRERTGSEVDPLREVLQGLCLAFVKQLTPEAKTYQPFLTAAYVQSLSTPHLPLRLSTELPATLAAWLDIM